MRMMVVLDAARAVPLRREVPRRACPEAREGRAWLRPNQIYILSLFHLFKIALWIVTKSLFVLQTSYYLIISGTYNHFL